MRDRRASPRSGLGGQFGLSPATKARLWNEARDAAVQDAYYSAKLYADVSSPSLIMQVTSMTSVHLRHALK